MNFFHYILLALSVLGILPTLRTAIKEKNTISVTVVILVSAIWCTLIVLSAYY